MNIFVFVVLLFQLSLVSGSDTAEELVYYTESGEAEFSSSVPLHTFTGRSGHLTGLIDPAENFIDFYLDMNTLRTGIGRRDRDMFNTLNVDEHPFAEFTGSFESDVDFENSGEQTVIVTGEFSVNGVTRDIRIEGEIQHSENEITIEAGWELLLEDYEIEPPGILFYRVDNEILIQIMATLHKRPREELKAK